LEAKARDRLVQRERMTPLFYIALFYKALAAARQRIELPKTLDPWGVGEALLYGEPITSGQLDKELIGPLPIPDASAFYRPYQLAGRGRGKNIWLS